MLFPSRTKDAVGRRNSTGPIYPGGTTPRLLRRALRKLERLNGVNPRLITEFLPIRPISVSHFASSASPPDHAMLRFGEGSNLAREKNTSQSFAISRGIHCPLSPHHQSTRRPPSSSPSSVSIDRLPACPTNTRRSTPGFPVPRSPPRNGLQDDTSGAVGRAMHRPPGQGRGHASCQPCSVDDGCSSQRHSSGGMCNNQLI